MNRSITKIVSGSAALVFAVLLLVGAGTARATTLPACIPGVNCLQYGDFNVYSLPLLDLQSGGDGVPGPGDPYYFSATYGAIKNYTILGINNGQCTSTGNPAGAIDCAYNTPSPNTTTSTVFSTKDSDLGGVKDPGPNPYFTSEFAGDTQNTWDATTVDLLSLINGTPLTAFFAFNETGSGTGLDSTSLLTWAEVTVTGLAGSQTFFLSSNRCLIGVDVGCVDDGLDPTHTYGRFLTTNTTEADTSNLPATSLNPLDPGINPWVYVHSGICTDASNNFVGFPDSSGNCPVGTTLRQQNNLGQNAAAFMINSPALDAALNCVIQSGPNTGQPCYSVMQVLWKMAYINGGGETAWIAPISSGGTFVPEPGTLANLGLALLMLGFLARKRMRVR